MPELDFAELETNEEYSEEVQDQAESLWNDEESELQSVPSSPLASTIVPIQKL